jgi:hypothetical protein
MLCACADCRGVLAWQVHFQVRHRLDACIGLAASCHFAITLQCRYKEITERGVNVIQTLKAQVVLQAAVRMQLTIAVPGSTASKVASLLATNGTEREMFVLAYLAVLGLSSLAADNLTVPLVMAGPAMVLNGDRLQTIRLNITYGVCVKFGLITSTCT